MTTKQKRNLLFVAVVAVAVTVGWVTHPVLTVLTIILIIAVAGHVWRRRRNKPAALLNRWRVRSKKHHGMADPWAVRRANFQLRRQAHILLPTIRDRGMGARWTIPITELGTPIIRVGRTQVMSSTENHVLVCGAPRQGKSGLLGDMILRPGPVLVTSTSGDLVRNTAQIRERLGPVRVFNPLGIGELASTVEFGLLDGCEDPAVARDRATDLLSATPIADSTKNKEWVEWAVGTLTALMHAAALGGLTMHHVQRWVANPSAVADSVLRLLQRSPHPSMMSDARPFFTPNNAQSSIIMTIAPALRWLSDPDAARCAAGGEFNVEEFLRENGTVYLLAENDSLIAPLVTAFAGHITRAAIRIAKRRPYERLEPGFTLVLDEAPSFPLQLPTLTADVGKLNIKLCVGAQSIPQLQARWGQKPADAILTNCETVVVFGGTRDPEGLRTFTTLCGSRDTGGVSLMDPAQFSQLPPLHAVVFKNGSLPTVGKPPMVWDRPDYRTMKRAAVWGPRLAVVSGLFLGRWRRPVPVLAPTRPMLALPPAGTAQRQLEAEFGAGFPLTTGNRDVK